MSEIVSDFDSNADRNSESNGSEPTILKHLEHVTRTTKGWNALCPCCDSTKEPKLDISFTRYGASRLHCWRNPAGHTEKAILNALKLDKSVLSSGNNSKIGSAMKALKSVWNRPDLYNGSAKMARLARRFEKELTRRRIEQLANSLGLPISALEDFSLGYCSARNAFVIPETNAFGEIIGIQFRELDGTKRTKQGSKRGLVGVSHLDRAGTLFICEGFSDTATLKSLGYDNVIGRPSATGGVDLIVQLIRNSRYDLAVIVTDPKPQEQDGARALGTALAPYIDFKIITPPEGKDTRAAVNSGATRGDFDNLIRCANIRGDRANVLIMADIPISKVDWLWWHRIALGKLTIIAGDAGLGKSYITTYLAACVSSGKGFHLGDSLKQPKRHVIMMNAEDDAGDTIRPRLEAHGADLSRIKVIDSVTIQTQRGPKEQGFALTDDLDKLERVLRSTPECRLIVIDPISAYMGDADTHKDSEVRRAFAPLAKLAGKYHVAVVVVAHLNKGDKSQPLYRVVGSIAFVAAARTAWLVMKDPKCEERRLMLPLKSNIGPDRGIGMAYRLVSDRVEWDDETIMMSASEAMAEQADDEDRLSQKEEAIEFLEEILSDGPMTANEAEALARASGIAVRTLKRAKKALKMKSKKHGSGRKAVWYWQLPGDDRAFKPKLDNDGK